MIINNLKSKLANSFDDFCMHRIFRIPCVPEYLTTYWFCMWTKFGDLLTPALLMRYGIYPIFTPSSRTDFIWIGTNLNFISPKKGSVIWGTGIKNKNDFVDLSRMNGLCLCGKISLDCARLSSDSDSIICDPGILASDLLIDFPKDKKYRLGIVALYQDEQLFNLKKENPDVKFINIIEQPFNFMKQMVECECVLSSSLHLICAAESLNIPSVLLEPPIQQGYAKYEDFYSAFDKKANFLEFSKDIKINDIEREAEYIDINILNKKKRDLRRSLEYIRRNFIKNGGGNRSIVNIATSPELQYRSVA